MLFLKKLALSFFYSIKCCLLNFFIILFLLASNVLLVTSTEFHSTVVELLERLPFDGLVNNGLFKKQKRLIAENNKLRKKNRKLIAERKGRLRRMALARKISFRIAKRTVRNVAIDISSVAGKAIPIAGFGVTLASIVLDIKDDCDTLRDVNLMIENLEGNNQLIDTDKVCGMEMLGTEGLLQSFIK